MTTSAQQEPDFPDSSVVESDESFAADAAPADSTETTAPKQPSQAKPKGDAPASGETPETPGEDATAKAKDPEGRWSKRVDRLTRQLRDAERREAYERGKREALEQHLQSGKAPASSGQADADPRPKLEQYESADDYADALSDWKLRQPDKGKPSADQQRQPEPRKGASEPAPGEVKPSETAVKSYQDAKLKYPDLDEVLFDNSLPWTMHIAKAVEDEPNSAEILYHLGQDEAELERISKLSPKQQEREVWRFAERLAAKSPAPSTPDDPDSAADDATDEPQARQQPRAPVSKAQPVPSTLSGSAPSGKSIEDMSDEEYIAYMNQQDRKAGRPLY